MTPTIDQLPQHILSEILRPCVTRESADFQPNVLQICSTFYLAAIPLLYHSPVIRTRPDSFFLHTPTTHDGGDIPLSTLSSSELVRTGHTKIAALRFVRNLSIILPSPYLNLPDPQIATNPEFDAEKTKRMEKIERATHSLVSLPCDIMSLLDTVRIGDIQHHGTVAARSRVEAGIVIPFATSLWQKTNCRIWCQYPSTLIIPPHPVDDTRTGDSRSQPTLYFHTCSNGPFTINPGGTTYIYIHRRAGHYIDRDAMDLEAMTITKSEWIQNMLKSTSDSLAAIPENQRRVTNIIIGGLMPVLTPKLIPPNGNGDEYEMKLEKEFVKLGRELAVEAGSDLENVTIEARRAQDMPICPGCGAVIGTSLS